MGCRVGQALRPPATVGYSGSADCSCGPTSAKGSAASARDSAHLVCGRWQPQAEPLEASERGGYQFQIRKPIPTVVMCAISLLVQSHALGCCSAWLCVHTGRTQPSMCAAQWTRWPKLARWLMGIQARKTHSRNFRRCTQQKECEIKGLPFTTLDSKATCTLGYMYTYTSPYARSDTRTYIRVYTRALNGHTNLYACTHIFALTCTHIDT